MSILTLEQRRKQNDMSVSSTISQSTRPYTINGPQTARTWNEQRELDNDCISFQMGW